MSRRIFTLGAMLVVAMGPLVAQGTGAPSDARDAAALRDSMARAIKAYEAFQVEAAKTLLESVVAPRSALTQLELASAYKYLGAAHAVLGRPDSAIHYFWEALKRDPRTDLDPAKFSRSELVPFNTARRTWLRSLMRDSATKLMLVLQLGEIRLGSASSQVELYVNGQPQGDINTISSWLVPAGQSVRVSIRAKRCALSWDTSLAVTAGQNLAIGRRSVSGCTP